MSPAQYRAAIKTLGLTKIEAANYFGISPRHSQRIAATGPVPDLVAKVIKLLISGKITKEDLL